MVHRFVCLLLTEFEYVELKELEIVGTMGVGGFGRVELVQYKRDPKLTFALKCLKKVDMVQQQQQVHAYNEKNIMMVCNSPFICRYLAVDILGIRKDFILSRK